jgi:hypothetical protein
MADVEFTLRIEQIGKSTLAGKGPDGKRGHEMPRCRRKNAAQMRAVLAQAPDQIERFIGGNAATDYEDDPRLASRRDGRPLVLGRRRRPHRLALGLFRSLPQDDPNFVFHRAAMMSGSQAQQLFE